MILNYQFGESDDYIDFEAERVVDFSKNTSFSYTFWNARDRYTNWYDIKAIDLLYISLAVFAADRLNSRGSADDAWSRNFVLHIPLLNKALFDESKELLQEMLSFLTGDDWKFYFRSRLLTDKEICHRDRKGKKYRTVKDYNQVCMFSGGLDSFIGAIDLLEGTKKSDTLFVSHYGGGKGTKEYQNYLKQRFIEQYGLEDRDFQQFHAKVIGGVEDTARSRSFMFFSHAVVLASALNKPVDIVIPENGFISLNIPSTMSRFGTSSTRTTHPYYLQMFQELLENLGLQVNFKNPYQFKTKGEMLMECKNPEFMKAYFDHTMSCSHPDLGRMYGEKQARHCGYCLPCVIRRAAIKKANLEDGSSYRDPTFSSGPNAKMILNSYHLGLQKFNPKYSFMRIQMNGGIAVHIEDYADLYIRGMEELKEYLDTVE